MGVPIIRMRASRRSIVYLFWEKLPHELESKLPKGDDPTFPIQFHQHGHLIRECLRDYTLGGPPHPVIVV